MYVLITKTQLEKRSTILSLRKQSLLGWYVTDLKWSYKWVKVFKNGPNTICGKQPLKNFKWYGLPGRPYRLPQILLGPFLNTMTQIKIRAFWSWLFENKIIEIHRPISSGSMQVLNDKKGERFPYSIVFTYKGVNLNLYAFALNISVIVYIFYKQTFLFCLCFSNSFRSSMCIVSG